MAKRISQQTFDDAVQENVNEFDQTVDEALADAIKQFKDQGIILDNIDISGGIGMNELNTSINTIKDYSTDNTNMTIDQIISSLEQLRLLSHLKHEYMTRNKSIIINNGCLSYLYKILDKNNESAVTLSTSETIISLTKTDG